MTEERRIVGSMEVDGVRQDMYGYPHPSDPERTVLDLREFWGDHTLDFKTLVWTDEVKFTAPHPDEIERQDRKARERANYFKRNPEEWARYYGEDDDD